MYKNIIKEALALENKEKSIIFSRFFKTDKGQYGEGDLFLGISVPDSRFLAQKHKNTSFEDLDILIKNKFHEIRLISLHILVLKYEEAKKIKNKKNQEEVVRFYLKNTKYINNWDLVDLSAYKILGDYFWQIKNFKVLEKLSKSKNLWEQRMSIISTFYFIKQNYFDFTFKLAQFFLSHKHDLIHKASGWMLREAGKRDKKRLIDFLNEHKNKIPRTMLRYAIEKFNVSERRNFLEK